MDGAQMILTIVGSVIGSGAVFGFVQFLITRRDNKIKEQKVDREEEVKKELKEHLVAVNSEWKKNYCDVNSQRIQEIADGLADNVKTGKHYYEEQKNALDKMTIEHQKEFLELKKAIDILTSNDVKITNSLQSISDRQGIMAESLVGQAHDRIIYMTDKISERGCVTNKEKATIRSMYEPYHKLGGNGEVEEAFNHVLTLKVVSEDEARKEDAILKGREYQEMRDAYENIKEN